jgi:hypothetical protein
LSKDSRPLPEPSWPAVIATTLRLWMQRHVLASARPNRPPRTRSYRGAAAAVLAIVVIGAAVAALTVARSAHGRPASQSPPEQSAADPPASSSPATSAPGSSASAPASSAALAAAAASRRHAAAWVAAQVSHGVIVTCDPLMCSALQQRGFPAADLSVITASSGDPLGSGIVVSTTAVRSQLGPRLATVYAPVIMASFGSGASLVQVRVAAAGGAAAYESAVQADLQARKVAGAELSGNKHIKMPSPARAELIAGQVDSRLLITLAALAHRFPVQIVSFSDSGPEAGVGVPLRIVTITASTSSYLSQLLAFLRAQRPPLLALVSQHGHGTTTTVQIRFTAPSPTGLLSAGASS